MNCLKRDEIRGQQNQPPNISSSAAIYAGIMNEFDIDLESQMRSFRLMKCQI